jgi:hypothetical protein
MKVSKFQLTREHFDYTLHRLANFSHVIFVEDLEASFGKFAAAYGWQYNFGGVKQHQHLDPKKQMELHSLDPYMTVLDDALYEFAKRKYHHLSDDELWDMNNFANQLLVDDYFRNGPSRGCINECCGECSKW